MTYCVGAIAFHVGYKRSPLKMTSMVQRDWIETWQNWMNHLA